MASETFFLIPPNGRLTGLDPRVHVGYGYGSLNPKTDYSDTKLAGAKTGSVYISTRSVLDPVTCQVTCCDVTMWLKTACNDTTCGCIGLPTDWTNIGSPKVIQGIIPIDALAEPWVSLDHGDIYHYVAAGIDRYYLKIKGGCTGDSAWVLLGAVPITLGTGAPNPTTNCAQPVGSIYVDTATNCPQVYIKLYSLCLASDWVNLASGCVYDRAGTPVGVVDATLCSLPLGAIVRDTTDNNRIYVKTTDLCVGGDYQAVQLRMTEVYACPPVITLNEVTQVLNVPPKVIGNRRRSSVTHGLFPIAAGTWTLITGNFNDIIIAQPSTIAPVAPGNIMVAPCDGYYRLGVQCGFFDAAAGVINGAGCAINGALTFMEYFPTPAPAAGPVASQCFLYRDVNLTAGDAITVLGYTEDTGGCDTGSWHIMMEWLAPRLLGSVTV